MATVSPQTPWSYALDLPDDPRSATVAQSAVHAVLEAYALEELTEETAGLVAKLLAPGRAGYRASGAPTSLRLTHVPPLGVRITVSYGRGREVTTVAWSSRFRGAHDMPTTLDGRLALAGAKDPGTAGNGGDRTGIDGQGPSMGA
ncbi:hypothetical protein Q3V23_20895 [Streptomyces sp. VNUA116]|uniref:hypothetical protein n=1 Tax=Streptomyces sp. VNUA116 TaxID=3062449 RepID=UPI002675C359|nr:hypothetical protein [Streptomyces sp. VNUA116]WKU46318.1 hypothetical protein Q3V23_20895 [Streptomyces sp. VNUA116]